MMRRGVAFAAAASAASPLSRAALSPWLAVPRRRFSERSTPREIFGLAQGEALDASVLKKRYKKLAKEWHPDTPGGDGKRMSMVNAAFDALSNEEEFGVEAADEPAPQPQQRQQQRSKQQASPRRASHPETEIRLRPWLHRILSTLDSFCSAVLGQWWPGWRIEAEGGGHQHNDGGDSESRREWAHQRRQQRRTADSAESAEEQLRQRHAEEDREYQRWMRAREREAQREQLLKEMREGQRGHQARAAARTVEIKEDLLVEGDELVAELGVGRPVWLWHGRERASLDTVGGGVRRLRQQKHELHRDRHHGHPLCEKRLAWYAAEMDKAADATPPNERRLAVLADVLRARLGDIGDISRFERHGIGAGAGASGSG